MSAFQFGDGMLVIDRFAEVDGTDQVHWFPMKDVDDEDKFPVSSKNSIRCWWDEIINDGFDGPMMNGTHKAWKKEFSHKPSARKPFTKK